MHETTKAIRELGERCYFALCLALGWLLRSGRYATTQIVCHNDERYVRKHRLFYAPLLVRLGDLLVRILNTGVRVLPQRDWEERERRLYRILRDTSIRIDADGLIVLPCLSGQTLATLLKDPEAEDAIRKKAIELAVLSLAEFHRLGFTHADAIAENVLVDLDAGVAHWFDFETVHDSTRPTIWRCADDVRALLTSCLARTVPEKRAETLRFILDIYANDDVARLLVAPFVTAWQRPLMFHLGQAALSFRCFRDISQLLRVRSRVPAHRNLI